MSRSLDIPILGTNRAVPFWLWGSLTFMALLGGAYLVFQNNYARHFWPRNFGVVEPGRMYRSGTIEPHLVRDTFRKYDVNVVISLQGRDYDSREQNGLLRIADEEGVEVHYFQMKGNGLPGAEDPTEAVREYARALSAIAKARRAGRCVWVHCGAGRHRTGGMVAMYRMLFLKQSPDLAYAELQQYGWDPRKHSVLTKWLNANMAAICKELVRIGALDTVPDPLPHIGP